MNELDALMDKDPLALSDRDIEDIITYHRRLRAQADGPRPKKDSAPGPEINLAAIGLTPTPAAPTVRRRI